MMLIQPFTFLFALLLHPQYVYILTVLLFITLVLDTVLSLAAFSSGTCNVFYWYIKIYKKNMNIYEYKSNVLVANVQHQQSK